VEGGKLMLHIPGMNPDTLVCTVLGHPLTLSCCFSCGKELRTENRSKEDVIPLWLQRAFGLADMELVLPNGTFIRYRKLKIPCCRACNNEHLSSIENRVSRAVLAGFEAANKLPDSILYQWLAKIFLGLLYKDLFLVNDRRRKTATNTIVTRELFENYKILWLWLHQKHSGLRPGFCPGSVFLYRCGIPSEQIYQFDLMDDFFSGGIAIRMGEVGIIADFLENGIHKKSLWAKLRRYRKLRLSPIQFKELAVRTFYGARLLEQETDVEFFKNRKGELAFTINWRSTTKGPSIFRQWRNDEFAVLLSHYLGLPYDFVYQAPDKVRTWLHNERGRLVHRPAAPDHMPPKDLGTPDLPIRSIGSP
jgi:hypothetical protein